MSLLPATAYAQEGSNPLFTFDVTERAEVYVLYDSRGVGKGEPSISNPRGYLPPAWLDSNFVQLKHDDGSRVQLCTSTYPNSLPFKRTFDAGTVRLGGNQTDLIQNLGEGSGDKNVAMYAVAVAPADGEVDGDQLIENIQAGESENPGAYSVVSGGVELGTLIYGDGDIGISSESHPAGAECDEDPVPDEIEGLDLIQTSAEDKYSAQDISYQTAVTPGAGIPSGFRLGAAYPNPFNSTARIDFSLKTSAHVKLAIYDMLGRRVATLADRRMQPGDYQATWNGAAGGEGDGRRLSAGVYLYQLRAGGHVDTGSLTLVK